MSITSFATGGFFLMACIFFAVIFLLKQDVKRSKKSRKVKNKINCSFSTPEAKLLNIRKTSSSSCN